MKKIIGIISAVLGFVITASSAVLCALIGFGLTNNLHNNASTIGIIGGADGPTAVFITKTVGKDIIFFGIFAIIGIALIISSYFMLRRKKTKEENNK